MNILIAISWYDRRPLEPLLALLDSLDRHPAGARCERVLCVNTTGSQRVPAAVAARLHGVLERPNVGMNIGAWDAAWRHWPGRDAYLFLQDECYAVRDDWLALVQRCLADRDTGLCGEALNPAWDKPWEQLRNGPGRDVLPEHFIDGEPANRVDVYLQRMRAHGIDPGFGGRHLRSLVWALRGDVLSAIDGFISGANYGECIAAEIGTSRAVAALGLELREFGPAPFHAFRHREWNQDRPGGPFTHKPVLLNEIVRLREEVSELRRRCVSDGDQRSALPSATTVEGAS